MFLRQENLWYNVREGNGQCIDRQRQTDCSQAELSLDGDIGRSPRTREQTAPECALRTYDIMSIDIVSYWKIQKRKRMLEYNKSLNILISEMILFFMAHILYALLYCPREAIYKVTFWVLVFTTILTAMTSTVNTNTQKVTL